MEHLEKWRMYRSGQFLFRMMLWEVPAEEVQRQMRDQARWALGRSRNEEVPGFVSFVTLIYSITEAYVFASRLAQAVPYEAAAEVLVGLRGINRWALGSQEFGADLDEIYAAHEDALEYSTEIQVDALVGQPLPLAVNAIQSIFRQFGWHDAADGMIDGWQRQIFH